MYEKWKSICKDCVTDPLVFSNFRKNEEVCSIVDGTSYDMSLECLPYIIGKLTDSELMILSEQDKLGNPITYYYPQLGFYFSPTTIRYIKIALDIKNNFGLLGDIVEIGVGYGGQCRVLCTLLNVKSYTLIDFPEVLDLATLYLKQFGITQIKSIPSGEKVNKLFGLCISNYAYSEMREDHRTFYDTEIVQRSENGYMLCNYDVLNRLKQLQPKGIVLPEIPYTDSVCFLYQWNY